MDDAFGFKMRKNKFWKNRKKWSKLNVQTNEWLSEWMNGIEWNRLEWLVKLKKNYKNKYERVSEWEEIEKKNKIYSTLWLQFMNTNRQIF